MAAMPEDIVEFSEKSIQLSTGEHLYADLGDAEQVLLFLHGFSFRPGLYPIAKDLSSHFRLVIPDLPFSVKNDHFPRHNLHAYVDFLLEFVAAFKLERISIFGNSVGGTLALMTALAAPGQFENLIVRSPLWSTTQLPWYLKINPLISTHAYLSRYPAYAVWMLKHIYEISARVSPVNGRQDENNLPYRVEQIDPGVLSKFLADLIQVEFTEKLKSMHARTLILWGEQDTFIPGMWGRHLEKLLPEGNIIISLQWILRNYPRRSLRLWNKKYPR